MLPGIVECNMAIYKARRGSESYGHAVGVLIEDIDFCPFIPGDVGNAATFRYPVIYRTIKGCTIERMLFADGAGLDEEIVTAAQELVQRGVKGITSNCGFLLRFQDLVTRSVDVPVFMSSLLQLPIILQSIGPHRAVGIITAHSGKLDRALLAMAGVAPDARIFIGGMQEEPEFKAAMMDCVGQLDSERLETEVVAVAKRLIDSHPEIAAILLECADLPPYAKAVQIATGLPVFDFTTLIDLFFAAQHRNRFSERSSMSVFS